MELKLFCGLVQLTQELLTGFKCGNRCASQPALVVADRAGLAPNQHATLAIRSKVGGEEGGLLQT